MKRLLAVARVLWKNRKAEIALVTASIALAREIIQASTGH